MMWSVLCEANLRSHTKISSVKLQSMTCVLEYNRLQIKEAYKYGQNSLRIRSCSTVVVKRWILHAVT